MNELFVQAAIEKYFIAKGYECKHEKRGIDLIAKKSDEDTWIIEAKGETSNPRVDFCTCIGQLLCNIDESNNKYGIAVPRTYQYCNQVKHLSSYVRKQLNLYILYINEDGDVEIIAPSETLE